VFLELITLYPCNASAVREDMKLIESTRGHLNKTNIVSLSL